MRCEQLSTKDALSQSDVVFSGKVLSAARLQSPPSKLTDLNKIAYFSHTVVFEPRQTWKGQPQKEQKLKVQSQYGYDNNPFEVGHSYVVFAKSDKDGSLYFPTCSMEADTSKDGLTVQLDNLVKGNPHDDHH